MLLRNHSDVDLRIYKGDRVAQLVVEKILELNVNCVEELTTTARGSRGFGYSAHEELYPWAEPDDPTYQHQELGTRNPVDRISVRAMRVSSGPERASMASTQQTSASEAVGVQNGLPRDRPEPAGHHQVPDPELWHRGTQTEAIRGTCYLLKLKEPLTDFEYPIQNFGVGEPMTPKQRRGAAPTCQTRTAARSWWHLGDDGL